MTQFAPDGAPIRSEWEIDLMEAAVVRRIFEDYATGISPTKIAEALYLEKVPGPQGGH